MNHDIKRTTTAKEIRIVLSTSDSETSRTKMATGHVFVGTSLDGFIARSNGAIDWLVRFSTLREDHGFNAHMARMDGVIMGRGTFEAVENMDPWIYSKPVLVLSKSLLRADLPDRLSGKVEVISATPKEVMEVAACRGWRRVYIDGGKVIQAFLRDGLVEDMVISSVPVLIGKGLPLFGALERDLALEHLHTRSFASGLVQSHYRILAERDCPPDAPRD